MKDDALLSPDDLERQIAVSRDAATLYHASVELPPYFTGPADNPSLYLIDDALRAAAVGEDVER